MKKALALSFVSIAALLAGCSHPQPYYGPPPPAVSAQEIHDRGVHDGFDAAAKDVRNNRPPSFDHHPLYRNPPVPPSAFRDYRQGFRQGYEQFLHQGPPPARPGA
jgi:hypothetical protein